MNITLIGMPGVGKSLIGRELAKRLNYMFVDVDGIIEKANKLILQQIIDKIGDERFLQIEEMTVLELGQIDSCVISPGGSVVYSTRAMNFLKNKSTLVYLEASIDSLKNRVIDLSTRRIVGLRDKGLESLFSERVPLYKKYADITIGIYQDVDMNVVIETIIYKAVLQENPTC